MNGIYLMGFSQLQLLYFTQAFFQSPSQYNASRYTSAMIESFKDKSKNTKLIRTIFYLKFR